MWLINKLEQDRWFNWQDRVFLKLVFQGRFSQEGWTAGPRSCSQCESCLVCCPCGRAGACAGHSLGKGPVPPVLAAWLSPDSINNCAHVQKAAVSIWLCLLISNLDSGAICKICSLNAHSGVLFCKAQQQCWQSSTLLFGRSSAFPSHSSQVSPQV